MSADVSTVRPVSRWTLAVMSRQSVDEPWWHRGLASVEATSMTPRHGLRQLSMETTKQFRLQKVVEREVERRIPVETP